MINDRIEDILADHPHLLPDEVYAAVTFAADDMAQEEMILASGQRWRGSWPMNAAMPVW